MHGSTRLRLILGGLLLTAALVPQPVFALCGNCGTFDLDVLACYANNTNSYCILVRCQVEGDEIGHVQPGYCCVDDLTCSF